MGIGIWSMHFIAMLEYHLPIPISYDPCIVLVSMVVAIVTSGVAVFVVSRQQMGWLQFFWEVDQNAVYTYVGSRIRNILGYEPTEEALRESEKRFRSVVEQAADGFFLHDINGKILNQLWEQMVPGKPITLNGIYRRKDGTTFPVEIRLGLFDADGCQLILGLVRDISDRKQAEAALRKSEAKNRALLNAIPDLMLRIRKDGTYLDYMPAKDIKMLVTGRELLGKNEYGVLLPAVAHHRLYLEMVHTI